MSIISSDDHAQSLKMKTMLTSKAMAHTNSSRYLLYSTATIMGVRRQIETSWIKGENVRVPLRDTANNYEPSA